MGASMIDLKFNIGDFVYMKTDVKQLKRIVTAIQIMESGIRYCLSCGEDEHYCYAIEISTERDPLISIINPNAD